MTTGRLIDPDDLMDTRQAADVLGVSRQRVQQLVQTGRLAAVLQREKITLLLREDVEAYVATREQRRLAVA